MAGLLQTGKQALGNRPKPKMAVEMSGGLRHGRVPKWSGNWPDMQKIIKFSSSGHVFGHLLNTDFSAIFGSGPVSHSVAGQPSRKSRELGFLNEFKKCGTETS